MICLQSKKLIQNSNICLYFIPLRPFKGFSSEYKVSCRHYMVWEKHKWSAFSLFSLLTSNAQAVPFFFLSLKPGI